MRTHDRLPCLALLLAVQVPALAACRSEQPVSEARSAPRAEAVSLPASLSLLTYNVLADPDPDDARMPALLEILAGSAAGGPTASAAAVGARAAAWRPWRAYAALHLWTAGADPARRAE